MLVRTDPFRDLDRFTHQLLGTNARPSVMLMDAWRDGDRFVVEFDLPGVNPDSVDLDVERNVLTVTAQRDTLDEKAEFLATERPRGVFSRQLILGENLDLDRIEAAYRDGSSGCTSRSRKRRSRGRSPSTATAAPTRPSLPAATATATPSNAPPLMPNRPDKPAAPAANDPRVARTSTGPSEACTSRCADDRGGRRHHTRLPESCAPTLGNQANPATIDAGLPEKASAGPDGLGGACAASATCSSKCRDKSNPRRALASDPRPSRSKLSTQNHVPVGRSPSRWPATAPGRHCLATAVSRISVSGSGSPSSRRDSNRRHVALVGVLAEHATGVVHRERTMGRLTDQEAARQVGDALDGAQRIAAATGVLMALHHLSVAQARQLLDRASDRTHRSLQQVADTVLNSGSLTDPPLPSS